MTPTFHDHVHAMHAAHLAEEYIAPGDAVEINPETGGLRKVTPWRPPPPTTLQEDALTVIRRDLRQHLGGNSMIEIEVEVTIRESGSGSDRVHRVSQEHQALSINSGHLSTRALEMARIATESALRSAGLGEDSLD